jgi:branched-chain amino acid transport system substrate-binding protein
MLTKTVVVLSIIVMAAIFLTACGAAPEPVTVVETVVVETEKEVRVVETVEVEKEVVKEVEVEKIVEVTAVPGEGAKPILIGFTSDASGQYANSGAMDRRGMMMAIEEFNAKGGVLGRPIEWVHMDTETTPATGTRIAERMINQDGVSFLVGAVHSGVANAISQVAQNHGVIYLNTNSSSPTESGENCHRVKFVFDGHGGNFAKATTLNAIETYGDNWLLLTNDYVWGHETSASTRALAEASGVSIVDELLVPQGTRDFSAYLLNIQQIAPDVVAAAVGGDDQKALRIQVVEAGLGQSPAWINNQQDWPDVYGQAPFGVFGTTWYYKLDLPGVDEFVQRYQEMYPDSNIKVPGNVFYNGYMATKALLTAIERAGTTNNHAVIQELEQFTWTAEERMQDHDAWIDPDTHQVQQTVYLGAENPEPTEEYDIFKILSAASPEDVMDKSADCVLESFEDTPVYEP